MDRAFGNDQFCKIFPKKSVHHLSVSHSDHLAIAITNEVFIHDRVPRAAKVMRFEPLWLREEECKDIFEKLWIPQPSPTATNVRNNITSIRDHLSQWSFSKFGSIPHKIKKIEDELSLLRSGNNYSAVKEASLCKELDHLLELHEEYWRTRSRVDWLKDGDRNTNFFHRKASQPLRKNRIHMLQNASRHECSTRLEMEQIILHYFSDLYCTNGHAFHLE